MAANGSSDLLNICFSSTVSMRISLVCTISRGVLTLPLCALVLFLGWRRRRCSSTTTSHSDVITYHWTVMVLIWALGCFSFLWGSETNQVQLVNVGICFSSLMFYGEALLHVLTCIERYLAVVHPITYMRLKNARGVRIRNASLGGVWLLTLGTIGITAGFLPDVAVVPLLCMIISSFLVVSFCSVSVLCVMVRPGPGARGREGSDPAKQRAFHYITAILGVLGSWFLGLIVAVILFDADTLSLDVRCVLMSSTSFMNLPSSLVLPLLYLHRAGWLAATT